MRLQRLDLTRYGNFTEHSIDFGVCKSGQPDLHIIYGVNEAGKSTALAAYLDLLYGIETRSRYDFLHHYDTMQIGAALNLSDTLHQLIRIKKRQMGLLDANGQPLDEGLIAAALSGIDRDAYRTMFSLDDDTLEAGGDSILASKGDVGQLLFSASTGLASLSHSLGELQGEVDQFFKARTRNTELWHLKSRLNELQTEKKQLDTQASTFAQLTETRDTALQAHDQAMTARTETKVRLDDIQRLLNGLPMLASFRKVEDELGELADLPEPPAEWAAEIVDLMENDTRLTTQLAGIDDEIKRIKDELDAIVLDEAAIAIADRIERLTESEARYRTAEDIPIRQLELNTIDVEIEAILRRLEQDPGTDPKDLILPASTVGMFEDLIESRSGIETELQTANKEHAKAEEQLKDARASLKAMTGEAGSEAPTLDGIEVLSATVRALQENDHAARLRLGEAAKSKHQGELADHLAGLLPWQGDVELLAKLIVPQPAQIDIWKEAIDDSQKQIDHHRQDIERLTTKRESQKAEIDAIKQTARVVDDDEAVTIRDERERAWDEHRAALDDRTASTFEEILRREDELTDARMHHATDIARLRESGIGMARIRADIDRASGLRDAAIEKLQAIQLEIANAIQAMAVPGAEQLPIDISVIQLEGWLERREKALQSLAAVKDADREIQSAKHDRSTAQDRLVDALSNAGVTSNKEATFETLLDTARAAIDGQREQHRKLETIRSDVAVRERELKDRARDHADATKADAAWTSAWADTVNGCWLRSKDEIPTIGSVRQILKETAAFGPAVEKRAGLVDRINKMQGDKETFVMEVQSLAGLVDETFAEERTLETVSRLRARLEEARRQQENRQTKTEGLEDAETRRRGVAEDLQAHQARKTQMTELFGATTLGEVNGKLEQVKRRTGHRERKSELEQQIIDTLRRQSFDEAHRALLEAERPALESEASELEARFQDQDQRVKDLFAQHSKAQDAISDVGGDASVAQIEEQRRTILLDIEDQALRHLRLKIGIAAAELALRAYRDNHRSSMMVHASDAFQTISRGAYSGLTTRLDKDTEVLIGMAAGGGSKLATEMSKGTRFQLYLALRVAGYYEFVRSRDALPFLADDILETFDDFRAEETFRLFAEMAEQGQVIYLTHHRHLCEIAQEVCPSVSVHELPEPQIASLESAIAAD